MVKITRDDLLSMMVEMLPGDTAKLLVTDLATRKMIDALFSLQQIPWELMNIIPDTPLAELFELSTRMAELLQECERLGREILKESAADDG